VTYLGVAQGETMGHLVSRVREQDTQFAFVRKSVHILRC